MTLLLWGETSPCTGLPAAGSYGTTTAYIRRVRGDQHSLASLPVSASTGEYGQPASAEALLVLEETAAAAA